MAIVVVYGDRPDLQPLCMNNGLTAAFFSVISIAASMQAETDHEILLATWIASHDQGAFGRGVVDFDLSEIPWSNHAFESDKQFMLSVASVALNRCGWDRLNYKPKEESVFVCLEQFRSMLGEFSREHVLPPEEVEWLFGEKPTRFEQCEKHRVYLHSHGCVLCNDE